MACKKWTVYINKYISCLLSNTIVLNILVFSALEVYSDQCGVQFYTGGRLPPYTIPEFLSSYDLLEVNQCFNYQQHVIYVSNNVYNINLIRL